MKQLDNPFTSYSLTEEETAQATDFTVLQVAFLRNLLAEAATKKLNLTYTPKEPNEFLQKEAELQGEIGLLSFLLSMSELKN